MKPRTDCLVLDFTKVLAGTAVCAVLSANRNKRSISRELLPELGYSAGQIAQPAQDNVVVAAR